jgi:hypothetical protein
MCTTAIFEGHYETSSGTTGSCCQSFADFIYWIGTDAAVVISLLAPRVQVLALKTLKALQVGAISYFNLFNTSQ